MATYPLKKVVFLVLVLAGVAILLFNILEPFQNEDRAAVARPSPCARAPAQPSRRGTWSRPECSYRGQEPSPEETLEERALLASIAWPEAPDVPTPLDRTSDPAHSHFTIPPAAGGRGWRVGEQLEAVVQMSDFQGNPKRYGGDVLVARLHDPELVAGVAGKLVDHLNGSYSAFFPLLWEGRAQVEVTLVHPSEAVSVLSRLTSEQPDRIFFKSLFRSGSTSESTVCNVCLPPGPLPLCNFTDLHTGEPWFCYKPKGLGCDARSTHTFGGYRENLKPKEDMLFKSDVNMKVSIPASGVNSVTVSPKEQDKAEVKPWSTQASPSGFYYQGEWRGPGGSVPQFSDAASISECLRDKQVHIFGDSTARQWFEYFNAALPELKEIDLRSGRQVGPFMAVDTAHNTLITYRCHAPPIRFGDVPTSQLRYVANEMDGLVGGANTVVVLSVWSHFGTLPVEFYIRRLRNIRRAAVRLLHRSPATTVVIRTANLKALTLYETITNSDWFSLQRDRVLRAMFKGLRVQLVDAWDMTLAHHLPHSLHPQPPIIKNMIRLLLSYVCPQKKA